MMDFEQEYRAAKRRGDVKTLRALREGTATEVVEEVKTTPVEADPNAGDDPLPSGPTEEASEDTEEA